MSDHNSTTTIDKPSEDRLTTKNKGVTYDDALMAAGGFGIISILNYISINIIHIGSF